MHVTSPNDVHADQAARRPRAGKHVVCEKPLGVDAAETADLAELAAASRRGQRRLLQPALLPPQPERRRRWSAAGAIGEPRYVTGSYHQDWLLLETDWNWRLDAGRQGGLRAVADIGSHWLDLVSFVTGRRVTEVLADLHTFVPERNHPARRGRDVRRRRRSADDVERVREQMASDDAAGMLLRFEGGVRGRVLGQPGVGRAQEHG